MSLIHTLHGGIRKYSVNENSNPISRVSVVDNWLQRILNNGGTRPSNNTISAVTTFYDTLVSQSIDTKMVGVNCFVPDNFTASITPLIKPAGIASGNDPWTNNAFTTADLTTSGLKGNGSKWLDTGLKPNLIFPEDSTGGISLYNTTGSNEAANDAGVNSAPNYFTCYIGYTGVAFFDCWNFIGGRISGANSTWAGFTSFNRTSFAASAVYKANSGTSFTTVASSLVETSIGQRPEISIYIFSANNAGSPISTDSKEMSFAAVHLGLTSAESQILFNAAQALRVSLGGGYL